MISPEIGVRSLAIGELVIGIGFFIGKWNKVVHTAFLLHMFGTFTPLFLLADVSFNSMPYALTLVGQYIIKNLLFVAVGIWMWRECK